jgi:hypothetical protein
MLKTNKTKKELIIKWVEKLLATLLSFATLFMISVYLFHETPTFMECAILYFIILHSTD